jgi:hypothetical protein
MPERSKPLPRCQTSERAVLRRWKLTLALSDIAGRLLRLEWGLPAEDLLPQQPQIRTRQIDGTF